MIDLTNPPLPTVSPGAPAPTLGSLVSRTFSTWWSQKWRLAATTLAILIPVYAAFFAVLLTLRSEGYEYDPFGPQRVAIMAFGAVFLLALMAQACGHTYGAFAHLSGQPVRIGTMLSVALGRIPTLFVLLVLGLVAFVVFAMVVAFLAQFLTGVLGENATSIILLLVLVPIVCAIATALSLTLPAVAAERAGPFRAMARSWRLSRDRRGGIFLTFVLVGVLLLAFLYLALRFTSAIQRAMVAQAFGSGWFAIALGVGAAVIVAVAQILVLPLFTVVPGVAYHDVRIEKEGTSTEELAQVFG